MHAQSSATVACVALLAFLLLLGGALRPRRAWRVRIRLLLRRAACAGCHAALRSVERTSYSASSGWLVHEYAGCEMEVSHLCRVYTCAHTSRQLWGASVTGTRVQC